MLITLLPLDSHQVPTTGRLKHRIHERYCAVHQSEWTLFETKEFVLRRCDAPVVVAELKVIGLSSSP